MLGFEHDALPPRVPSEDVLELARGALESGDESEGIVATWYPARQSLKVRVAPLGEDLVVVMEDVSAELLAQRVRREFVAHASHELKSPVAGIQALAEALLQAVGDDPEAASRFANRIIGESDRLGRLIGDLLDLSRLEDSEQIPQEPVDMCDLGRREVDELQELAGAKGVTLLGDCEGSAWVRGDEHQLGLLIRNLLDNAIRYSPDGGTVRLSVEPRDDSVAIIVIDDGIGISLEAQGRVFERFYRVDRARSRDRGGTGLGLAIVKHAAELHGGSVTVESELGHGSRFTALLPRLADGNSSLESIAG
jgi:signal transduction histidine kinase